MSNETREAAPVGGPGVLVVVCLALFFGVLNGSAVAVVLPEIGRDLDVAAGDLPWVLSGFLLTYGVAIPFYGRLAGRFGARPLFLLGVGVFALGSVLAALAPSLGALLAARTLQAAGGAAVPGLGMTLASRAYPESRRGFVLGVVSATMGLGAAAGPLAAGLISEIADWRWLFALSATAIVSVPLGIRFLDPREPLSDEPLDLAGGALFASGVASLLFVVSRGGQVGWTALGVWVAAALSMAAFAGFAVHHRRAEVPFVPRALVENRRYLRLTVLGFAVTFANLAVQIGLPFVFTDLHGLSTLGVGLALVPAALITAVVGVLAGRMVDRVGAGGPVRAGATVMALTVLLLSSVVGASAWSLVLLATVFAVGFALVNTPLAAAVSLSVEPEDLAAALSLNTMMFFIGGSFGATLFTAIALDGGDGSAWNPLHDGPGGSFSDAFLALIAPVALAAVIARSIPGGVTRADDPATPDAATATPCDLPWCPELDQAPTTPTGASTHV